MHETKRIERCWLLVVSLAILVIGFRVNHVEGMSSANYTIDRDMILAGGGEMESSTFNLFLVVGQPSAIGSSLSSNYFNYAGYFSLTVLPPISPEMGTIGTKIRITGSGFGPQKGKILIGKVAPKVLDWKENSILCQLTKSLASGTYDVKVQAKGLEEIVYQEAFSVVGPVIDSIDPLDGEVTDEITVWGRFFGIKKGKVYLVQDGFSKACKVTAWTMDPTSGEGEIKFVVPRGLKGGDYFFKVVNGVGEDVGDDEFSMLE